MDQMKSDQEMFYELSYYTLAHPDPAFIHQYIVDAYTAQHADEKTKPIAITFALIGLYLHLEKHYSGKEVQKAHMQLAKNRKKWPLFLLPKIKGMLTVADVVSVPAGPQRDQAIREWSVSVCEAWKESHVQVADLVRLELGDIYI